MVKVNIKSKKFIDKVIYEDSSLEIFKGINLIQGENGSGKTTLLNILFRLDKDYDGQVLIDDKDIKEIELSDYRTNYVNYINQSFDLFLELSPMENIKLLLSEFANDKFDFLVGKFNIEDVVRSKKKVKNFSGGQKQKIKILIGLLSKVPILLIDEPDNNLDLESVEFLAKYLEEENRILIVVAHTFDDFLNIDKVNIIQIKDKKIISENNDKKIISENDELVIGDNIKSINNVILKKFKKELRFYRVMIYILVFIFSYLFMYNSLIFIDRLTLLDDYSPPMKGNVVEIFIPSLNSTMIQNFGDVNILSKTPFYFTSDFYKTLQEQEEVKNIIPIGEYGVKYTSSSFEVDLSINTSKLNYNKYGMEKYHYMDSTLSIMQNQCTEPKVVNTNGLNMCSPTTEIIFGEYPDDNTNEIIIDPYIAMYLAEERNLESLDNLIGQEVSIEVQSFKDKEGNYILDENGVSKRVPETKKYIISGISDPMPTSSGYSFFATAYQEGSITELRNHPWKDGSGADMAPGKKTNDELALYPFYSAYEALGLPEPTVEDVIPIKDNAYPGFYIETKTDEDVESLIRKIEDYDPYIYIKSNYTTKNSSNFKYMKKYIIKEIIKSFLIILILFIGLTLLIRYYSSLMEKNIIKFARFGLNDNNILKYTKMMNNVLIKGIVIILLLETMLSLLKYGSLEIFIINILFLLVCYIFVKMQVVKFKGERNEK